MTSSAVTRYLVAAALVACGLLLSLLTFEQQDVRVLSRLIEPAEETSTIGGIVRPASESVVSVELPVAVTEVLVEPGEAVQRGQAMFIVDDRDARMALPAARLEVEDAQLEMRMLELGVGTLDRRLQDLSSRFTRLSGELDVAARRVSAVPTPQSRDSVARAQANADLAALRLDRVRTLFAQGVVPRQEVDDAEAAMRMAEDGLELARQAETAHATAADVERERAALRVQLASVQGEQDRMQRAAQLGRAQIRYERAVATVRELEQRVALSRIDAPATGTVSEVRVSRGDLAMAGAVLARMADLSRLVIEVGVPTADVPQLRVGGRVQVRVSGAEDVQQLGIIRSIEPTAGPGGTHRVVVGFEAPAGIILSGQAATVTFPREP